MRLSDYDLCPLKVNIFEDMIRRVCSFICEMSATSHEPPIEPAVATYLSW